MRRNPDQNPESVVSRDDLRQAQISVELLILRWERLHLRTIVPLSPTRTGGDRQKMVGQLEILAQPCRERPSRQQLRFLGADIGADVGAGQAVASIMPMDNLD